MTKKKTKKSVKNILSARRKRAGLKAHSCSDDLVKMIPELDYIQFIVPDEKGLIQVFDGTQTAGGKTMKEALEWLIIARYEAEHPYNANVT